MKPLFIAVLLFGFVHPGSKFILGTGLNLLHFCVLYSGFRFFLQLPGAFLYGFHRSLSKAQLFSLAGLGILGAALQITELKGLDLGLPVGTVTFLLFSYPAWVLLFSSLINQETITIHSIAKVLLSLIGIFLIVGNGLSKLNLSASIIYPLLASLFMALWICLSNFLKKNGCSIWAISFYHDAFSFAALLLFSLQQKEGVAIDSLTAWLSHNNNLPIMTAYALFLGVMPNLLFYRASQYVSAFVASLVLILEPVISSMVSIIAWNETLSSQFYIGATLILAATFPSGYFMRLSMKKIFLKSLRSKTTAASFFFVAMGLLAPDLSFGASINDPPAIHGMLIVGNETVYLSHLPMFHRPHDYQVILEVNLAATGINPQAVYALDRVKTGERIYTIVPNQAFVLPDVVGNRKPFFATLFRGHFERGGVPIIKNVLVNIKKIIFFQKFNPNVQKPNTLWYLLFGKGKELFLAHFITTCPDFDQVHAIATTNPIPPESLPSALLLKFPNRPVTSPLKEGEITSSQVGSSSHFETIKILKQYYFETGDLSCHM